jgi:hypothetical protein
MNSITNDYNIKVTFLADPIDSPLLEELADNLTSISGWNCKIFTETRATDSKGLSDIMFAVTFIATTFVSITPSLIEYIKIWAKKTSNPKLVIKKKTKNDYEKIEISGHQLTGADFADAVAAALQKGTDSEN